MKNNLHYKNNLSLRPNNCIKVILDTLDLVVGDDLVVYSSVTKMGVKEVLKKLEDLVEETI